MPTIPIQPNHHDSYKAKEKPSAVANFGNSKSMSNFLLTSVVNSQLEEDAFGLESALSILAVFTP